MATLDQLAQQGDPGTLRTEQQAGALRLMNPQQLYELWERQHWSAHEIDFEARLARVREELNDAFTRLFDDALVEAGRRLVADPRVLEAKVDSSRRPAAIRCSQSACAGAYMS